MILEPIGSVDPAMSHSERNVTLISLTDGTPLEMFRRELPCAWVYRGHCFAGLIGSESNAVARADLGR
jgi:hypothetical protein